MARQLLVVEEALAILKVIGAPNHLRERFQAQVSQALKFKPRGDVDDDNVDSVTVNSGYGSLSKRGFVELTINTQLTQMDAKKAREIGLMLIEASEAAQSDEMMVAFLKEKVHLGDNAIGAVLMDLREVRQGTKGTSNPS